MRAKTLLITFCVAVIAGLFALNLSSNDGIQKYIPRHQFRTSQATGISGAIEWFNMRRANQITGKVDIADVENARKQAATLAKAKNKSIDMQWIEMGPSNIGGRTRSILIDRSNNDVVFAGSVSGGLWKSTTGGVSWVKVPGGDLMDNLNIGSICQTANGYIYAGTGESFAASNLSGFQGAGIFRSTDHGNTWEQLVSTWNDNDDSKMVFKYVNKLAAHPTNSDKFYAATARGLRVTTDGGQTWTNPISGVDGVQEATDVKISEDGTVVIASVNNKAYVCNTNDDVFVKKSGVGMISVSVQRLEFGIAPSNSNYIYCFAASTTGGLQNVYKSTDKGETWTALLSNMSEVFQPFGSNGQGGYDNVIAVYPDDPEHIILGGVDLYKYTPQDPWQQISAWYLSTISPYYVHADMHTIVFHPNYQTATNPNGNLTMYVGCDGGIFRSIDGGVTWKSMNKNYNVTQCYAIDCGGNGTAIGGTQDNGTFYLNFQGTSIQDGKDLTGGDGGYCIISELNPQVVFSTVYYGQLHRSEDGGDVFSSDLTDIFSNNLITAHPNLGVGGAEPFITPITIWESFNDNLSTQYVTFKADTNYVLGDEIKALSATKHSIYHTITQTDIDNAGGSIEKGDTLYILDKFSSQLAIGLGGKVWMTREGLDFSKVPPKWNPITTGSIGTVSTLKFSADGNYLYFADYSSVYRCSNILNARADSTTDVNYTSCVIETQKIGSFSQTVTGLAVDPQNPNNLIVTVGNYGNTNYVYYSTNAATTTSTLTADNFTTKQGNLPACPAYSAVINWNNSQMVFVGTEFGVYATEDITAASPVWTDQNTNGLAHLPVLDMIQQIHPNGWMNEINQSTGISNHGFIYAGTHGRGIFRSETYRGPVGIESNTNDNLKVSMKVYPNPVVDFASVDFTLSETSDVSIRIFNLKGQMVKNVNLGKKLAGKNTYQFDTEGLQAGTYLISVSAGEKSYSGKFLVY